MVSFTLALFYPNKSIPDTNYMEVCVSSRDSVGVLENRKTPAAVGNRTPCFPVRILKRLIKWQEKLHDEEIHDLYSAPKYY